MVATVSEAAKRETWATRLGLILAMAGNAIGLGNFWRFPRIAVQYGGGAFLIPYFLSLVILGIPLMFVEWTQGRYGGKHGYGHMAPVYFLQLREGGVSRDVAAVLATVFGALYFMITLIINPYYTHIIGWTLAYALASLAGLYMAPDVDVVSFLGWYIGANPWIEYLTWIISLGIICYVVACGVQKGLERWAKIMMPALYIAALILVVASLTSDLWIPKTLKPYSAVEGLGWLWRFDVKTFLKDPFRSTIEAAGQIFYTLSLGMGIIQNYASYLREDEDIPLGALTTSMLNEFAEVILAGSIVIPLAYGFLGLEFIENVRRGKIGSVGLTFITIPNIFKAINQYAAPLGNIYGFLWFIMLWFAGMTSAFAMFNYVTSIFTESFKMPRLKGALITLALYVLIGIPVEAEIHLTYSVGGLNTLTTMYLDTLDYFAGAVALLLAGLIEFIVGVWVFGFDRMYEELHKGAAIRLPRLYLYTFSIIAPIYILIVFFGWILYYKPPVAISAEMWEKYPAAAFYAQTFMYLAYAVLCIVYLVGLYVSYKSLVPLLEGKPISPEVKYKAYAIALAIVLLGVIAALLSLVLPPDAAVFMVLGWGFILGTLAFCIYKYLLVKK